MAWGDKTPVHVHNWKREATTYAPPVTADEVVKIQEAHQTEDLSEELIQELLQGRTQILFTCEDPSCDATREEYLLGGEAK